MDKTWFHCYFLKQTANWNNVHGTGFGTHLNKSPKESEISKLEIRQKGLCPPRNP